MTHPMRLLLTLLPLTVGATACVYRQDIPQGNFFKAEDVARLEAGMTREQVRYVMGTPMIQDPFHPDRWDYLFYIDSQADERDRYQRVTVFFEADRMERFETEGVTNEAIPIGNEGIVVEEEEDIFPPGGDN